MVGKTRNLSLSEIQRDDKEDPLKVHLPVLGHREILNRSLSQNSQGVNAGSLRNPRVSRLLKEIYGDAYFGLGASCQAMTDHIEPVSSSVFAQLQSAVRNRKNQLSYRVYRWSDLDQMSQLQQVLGKEISQYPNFRTAVCDINRILEEDEKGDQVVLHSMAKFETVEESPSLVQIVHEQFQRLLKYVGVRQ